MMSKISILLSSVAAVQGSLQPADCAFTAVFADEARHGQGMQDTSFRARMVLGLVVAGHCCLLRTCFFVYASSISILIAMSYQQRKLNKFPWYWN